MQDQAPQSSPPTPVPAKRGPGRPRKSPPALPAQERTVHVPPRLVPMSPAQEDSAYAKFEQATRESPAPPAQATNLARETADELDARAPAQEMVRYFFRKEIANVARVYRVEGDMSQAWASTMVLRLGNGSLPAGVTVAAEMCTRRVGDGPVHEIRADGVDDFVARIAAGNWKG